MLSEVVVRIPLLNCLWPDAWLAISHRTMEISFGNSGGSRRVPYDVSKVMSAARYGYVSDQQAYSDTERGLRFDFTSQFCMPGQVSIDVNPPIGNCDLAIVGYHDLIVALNVVRREFSSAPIAWTTTENGTKDAGEPRSLGELHVALEMLSQRCDWVQGEALESDSTGSLARTVDPVTNLDGVELRAMRDAVAKRLARASVLVGKECRKELRANA